MKVWIIKEGRIYTNGYLWSHCFTTKKAAESWCRKDGFKYNSASGLFLGVMSDGEYWRSIEPLIVLKDQK